MGTQSKGMFLANGKSWDNIGEPEGLPGNKINGLLRLDGKLLIATDKGLSVMDRSLAIDNGINKKFNITGQEIFAIAKEKLISGEERVWLYGENWLGYFKKGTEKLIRVKENLGFHLAGVPYKILPDTFSGVYVANPYTVYYINYRTGEDDHGGGIRLEDFT